MITAGVAGQIQILTINGAVKKQQERNHPCSGNSRHLDDDYRNTMEFQYIDYSGV